MMSGAATTPFGPPFGLPFGISEPTLRDLRRSFEATPGVQAVWIFGSRARGTAREASDIDLAVDAPTLTDAEFAALQTRLLELPTLYKIDTLHWQRVTEPVLRAEVERDRRVLWQPARHPVTAAMPGGVVLKDFQEQVLDKLAEYLAELQRHQAQTEAQARLIRAEEGAEETLRGLADYPRRAWDALRKAGALPALIDGQSAQHQSRWAGDGQAIPNVCLKVPTGGGKTLLAAAAVGQIMQSWQRRSTGLVLWVVPGEAIYRQTLKALSDRDHPYRQLLNVAGAGRVKVLEKTSPLTRQDTDSHLCVMLLMLQSAARASKETLKVFRDRGNVLGFTPRDDDIDAHGALLRQVPNLDVYRAWGQSEQEARAQRGSTVKSSLGNVLRVLRPLVVIDEGHHAYSETALKTLDGFNPGFMLELSATPRLGASKKGVDSSGSNILVNVRGVDLDRAEMIKLPIHVDVRGWSDWQACLTAALARLDVLQAEADTLQAETARYIRPILLVQVERTGADTRESGLIHADDARAFLLGLGLQERHVATKTSERNDLNAPENIELLSPRCEVRVIITKQALQEGWDCPFAYVLCALAAGRNLTAMTQLVGRILRLPHTAKTGREALDACYVLCHDAKTGNVVGAIKKSLEGEGLGDLGVSVQAGAADAEAPRPLPVQRRAAWQGMRLFLPQVTWVGEDGSRRQLVYDSDVLAALPWHAVLPQGWVSQWAPDATGRGAAQLSVGLELLSGAASTAPPIERPDAMALDAGRVVRALTDLAPNPWLAWDWLSTVRAELRTRGFADSAVAGSALSLIETLRQGVQGERDRLAEVVFGELLAQGRIEFRLRADSADYELPQGFELLLAGQPAAWSREGDALAMQRTLYVPSPRTPDINEFEHRVAGWLDQQQAVRWWHRNVARTQLGLQGWKRGKVYPDFVFAMHTAAGQSRVVLLETKGLHLKNDDTLYKQALLQKLSAAYRDERWQAVGKLGLRGGSADEVQCDLVFESGWQGELNLRHFNQAAGRVAAPT